MFNIGQVYSQSVGNLAIDNIVVGDLPSSINKKVYETMATYMPEMSVNHTENVVFVTRVRYLKKAILH